MVPRASPAKDLQGVHRLREGQSQEGELRQRRHRHADAPRGGEPRVLRGRRPRRTFPTRARAAAHRPHRRPDPARHANLAAALAHIKAGKLRALAVTSRPSARSCPTCRRAEVHPGLRERRLVRPDGARRHAARHRRRRSSRQREALDERPRGGSRAGHGAGGQHARRVRRRDPRGERALGARDHGARIAE